MAGEDLAPGGGANQPWLDLPLGSYFPAWVEIVNAVRIVALGIIGYLILTRVIGEKAASA